MNEALRSIIMAIFRFELNALLKKQRMCEDDAQRELAKILRQRMILQSQIQEDQGAIGGAKQNLTDALIGAVDLDRVRQFAQFSGELTQRAQMIVVRLAGLEGQITRHRERLAEAVRQRKAVELLHDRRLAVWKRTQTRRETAELDEVALEMHRRQYGAMA